MKILGIDPGFDRLGLAVLEGSFGKPTVLWSDCIKPSKGETLTRLRAVYVAVENAITTHKPDAVAIEGLFFATNKKTALQVAEARGAILAAIGAYDIPVHEYTPNQIKVAVAGNGRADKLAIARMIPQLVTLDARNRIDDELDAIAIAITCFAVGIAR
jgi:crossover junction endodeoxyribonuclease RuvC